MFFTLASASMILAHSWQCGKTCSQSDHDTSIWYHRWASIKTKFTATPPHPSAPSPTFRRLFFSPKPPSACWFFICPRSTCEPVRRLGFWEQTGSLSKNDGDGYENVSLKVKSRCFKNVIALIPTRSIRQMLAIFFWIWILKNFIKVQEKKTKVVVVCSRPPQNVKLGIFTS